MTNRLDEFKSQIHENGNNFFGWYNSEANDADRVLCDRVSEFGGMYFQDMIFAPGTKPYDLVYMHFDNGDYESLSEEIEYFNYDFFRFKVEHQEDCEGSYNMRTLVLTVEPGCDDSVILHEMIHLHEEFINEFPMFYHDMLLWSLYTDLREKISYLDELITEHAHMINQVDRIGSVGGVHDVLFLLKSFDLDLRMGYELGTVFGYEKEDEFRQFTNEHKEEMTQ